LVSLDEAYAACQRLAESHYENFPVASKLLPSHLRKHIAAVYAFARTADDFADEPGRETSERLTLLADWKSQLHARVPGGSYVFVALHDTIERFDLPIELFDDLLSAFSQDVITTRYATWVEVMDYCRRSANPVGRLVLRLSGYRDEALARASDAVCSALQLTNFWQDLAIDWSRGRLYVPEEVCRRCNARPDVLGQNVMTPEWAAAMKECATHTRALFAEGRPVCDGVSGRLRYELRATWLGGTRILDRLEAGGFDVFTARPKLGARDALVIACKTVLWKK
jgi:phytoene synthase